MTHRGLQQVINGLFSYFFTTPASSELLQRKLVHTFSIAFSSSFVFIVVHLTKTNTNMLLFRNTLVAIRKYYIQQILLSELTGKSVLVPKQNRNENYLNSLLKLCSQVIYAPLPSCQTVADITIVLTTFCSLLINSTHLSDKIYSFMIKIVHKIGTNDLLHEKSSPPAPPGVNALREIIEYIIVFVLVNIIKLSGGPSISPSDFNEKVQS